MTRTSDQATPKALGTKPDDAARFGEIGVRRQDRYEIRARELAIADGKDPHGRVERPGLRSMPVWCTYRDAARAEHVATETAAVAAALPSQAPQYQGAPLQVIGQHDAGTVDQMSNCMKVGNVLAGVICADGHLGYAQPVGGVIAYEKQISISGVGFDIGCGNMAVRLDTKFSEIEDRIGPIIKDVVKVVSFGVGRTNEPVRIDPGSRQTGFLSRDAPAVMW
jgi:tRNA-splicing ligase RtcB